jgi:hypothetical protein
MEQQTLQVMRRQTDPICQGPGSLFEGFSFVKTPLSIQN